MFYVSEKSFEYSDLNPTSYKVISSGFPTREGAFEFIVEREQIDMNEGLYSPDSYAIIEF